MYNENNKKMTPEEMEKNFKDKMFQALAQKNPGVHMDQDGFIFHRLFPANIRPHYMREPSALRHSLRQNTV